MNYSLLIQWSPTNQRYLVTIAEFNELVMQPCTSGTTYQDAIENAQDCIEACLEYCRQETITPPLPVIAEAA
jgi:predicted RNase H-like HicB family nuclease